eukprot:6832493-Pyramimonas_sp.AAC.1
MTAPDASRPDGPEVVASTSSLSEIDFLGTAMLKKKQMLHGPAVLRTLAVLRTTAACVSARGDHGLARADQEWMEILRSVARFP